MWTLDCDGDFLNGKRIWLRPGRMYLFGRTKPEDGKCGFEIGHKSVSRKHLTITVTHVRPDDGHGKGPRSHLVLKDEGTKVGTIVDGNKIRGESVTLHDDAHHFRLGALAAQFRIVWKPVVLSFNFPSKDTSGGKDPLAPIQSRIEDLDVQAILPYDRAKTTHVVANKRNTAKSLQALVNGKYVVDHPFIDALVYAATPSSLDEPESLSPLEIDFDANFPRALDYVPPPSKEPGQRPAELFEPDPARQAVFENYIFVFGDQRQCEILAAPITDGSGSALHLSVVHGSTTAEEIVAYLREVNNKKASDLATVDADENILLVAFKGERGYEKWADEVQRQVQNLIGLEIIEQNEFLDVILIKDPGRLKRKVPIAATTAAPQAAISEPSQNDPPRASSSGPPRPSRARGVVRSAFKGFDDGFSDFAVSQQTGVGSEGGAWPSPNLRKRSPPSSPPPSSDHDDTLFPAAAAMKRRRMQEGGTPSRSLEPEASASPKKSPRVKKELDIAATVLERRKAQDAEKQNEEQALQQSLSDLSFEEMNKLARVEEMEVPERKPRSSRSSGGVGEAGGEPSQRWDPAWNGRKNFKRFRRQGTNQELRRGQTVIVPLEEVQKRTMGIGEHYWLEPSSSRQTSSRQAATRPQISRQVSGRTERERESRRQLTRENSENSDDAVSQSRQTFASARSQLGERAGHGDQEVVEIPKELADLNDSQVVDVEEPRLTRRQEKEKEQEQEQAGGGNAGTTTAARAGTKRSAQSQVARGGSKRQKTATTAASRGGREDGDGDGSDSDDGLKFRIRRRKG